MTSFICKETNSNRPTNLSSHALIVSFMVGLVDTACPLVANRSYCNAHNQHWLRLILCSVWEFCFCDSVCPYYFWIDLRESLIFLISTILIYWSGVLKTLNQFEFVKSKLNASLNVTRSIERNLLFHIHFTLSTSVLLIIRTHFP